MEDHRLKAYCLVVETKSFSQAAQAVHITQSAMSRLIKNLEDKFGVPLLHRKGRAVVPTAAGRLLYEHAQNILDAYSLMEQSLDFAARDSKRILRLGASRTPAVHFLPQVIYDFSKAYPEIKLDLSVCKPAEVFRKLADGKIDVGIVKGTIQDHTFSAVTVAEDEVVIIAPENHPLTKKKNVSLRDLAAESLILPDYELETRKLIDNFFRNGGIDPRRIKARMILDNPESIVQMVKAGLGIAFASKWSIFTAVKEGTVKLLEIPGKKMKEHFYLISSKQGSLSSLALTFREFVKKHSFFIPF